MLVSQSKLVFAVSIIVVYANTLHYDVRSKACCNSNVFFMFVKHYRGAKHRPRKWWSPQQQRLVDKQKDRNCQTNWGLLSTIPDPMTD
jgi:hypothetical protein